MKLFTLLLFSLLLLNGCTIAPQPIVYGTDGCHFCKMTIVDKLHAAELVTKKGKVYKFDATECMVNIQKTMDTTTIKLFLTTNYSIPEQLIDATTATYLISENIPSPMGEYLSAFESKENAVETQKTKGGKLYTWPELLIQLKK